MKLSRRIILSISVALVILFSIWAFVFYQTSKSRIYGHIDNVLIHQSDKIISRFMVNDSLPNSLSGHSGTMEYFIEKVTPEYAATHQTIGFQNNEDYIDDLNDEEAVRELTRVFNKMGTNYELTLTVQVFAWNDTLDFAVISILTLAVVLLIVVIIIVSLIIIGNMRPLNRLTNWLRNRKENEDIPQPDKKIKVQEFKEIESAVLAASKRSKQLFEEQKRFIGNASHEIQTPLAVCRNRLELLVDNTQLDEHQLSEIEKTLDSLGYISRLNKSLLMLTRIENHQFKEETEININQVASQALGNLNSVYESHNIEVKTDERGTLLVRMDSTLASSLVTNLLKNAFIHNKQGGCINIKIGDEMLFVSNTGTEKALDANAIFQTFYKRSDNHNSSGLGLTIAKAICDEYGFEIRYQFIENQHVFSVKFK